MKKIYKKYLHQLKIMSDKLNIISYNSNNCDSGEILIAFFLKYSYKNINILEKYNIKILFNKQKNEFPIFFEVNNKIPTSFHKNPKYEDLCVGVPAEKEEFFFKQKSLSKIINRFLVPFLYNFSFLKNFGEIPFGEYSHGEEGIKEFYINRLNMFEIDKIKKCIDLVLENKLDEFCPCGSENNFKKCHYKKIRNIPITQIEKDKNSL